MVQQMVEKTAEMMVYMKVELVEAMLVDKTVYQTVQRTVVSKGDLLVDLKDQW